MKQSIHKKGFTLIEMLISVFIFLMIMLVVVVVFAQHAKLYTYAKTLQRNIENAQFAINYVAKTLRTGSIMQTSDTQNLYMYDPSQSRCFRFRFIDGTFETTSGPALNSNECGSNSFYLGSGIEGPFSLTTGDVDGHFAFVMTERDDQLTQNINETEIGRVMINIEVADQHQSDYESIYIQTAVSLRNYPSDLTF